MASSTYERPRWMRDLSRFLPLKSQFVLSGNVRDLQVVEQQPGMLVPVTLVDAINFELNRTGYQASILYRPMGGFQTVGPPDQRLVGEDVMRSLGLSPTEGRAPGGIDLLGETFEKLVACAGDPIALLIDFASRLVVRRDVLSEFEHRLFVRTLVLSHTAQPRPAGPSMSPYFNTAIWIVERESDLPDWLLIDNPRIRHISISKPDHRIRRSIAPGLLKTVPGSLELAEPELAAVQESYVDETEGLLLVDMKAITQLARAESVPLAHIGDAVRRYKVGVTEDPWRNIDREKIRNADSFVRARVKGQTHAVTHMLDIIKRAITGIGAGKRGGRPRGVAFLAGPTGVGKTELAKTMTSLLFGDESSYIRFDMSEFSAEHSDQRLIGAPPGYVGYDAGGELTNAIREKPFSVVLFDEIEKAHPRILDKFLQILDDGVLTSGRGDRVYFSEAFIVFTSNLGIYRTDSIGERVANVTPQDGFEVVRERVLAEIERHFKLVLNRPEILNRIGDNVIVFDFIRPNVAGEILDNMVAATLAGIGVQDISVSLSDPAKETLRRICLEDLSNGGRGIRNKVEAHLVNPLGRALFDQDARPGSAFEVLSLEPGVITTLALRNLGGARP